MAVSINADFELGLDPTRIREELERVLSSPKFRKSQSHCEFLRYVVEKRLKSSEVEEAEIGVRVYRRDATYDPNDDAIVRVEASRLRARLKEYYEEAGRQAALRFDLPRGTFSPVIVMEGTENERPANGIWRWAGILIAILGMLILGGVAWKSLG